MVDFQRLKNALHAVLLKFLASPKDGNRHYKDSIAAKRLSETENVLEKASRMRIGFAA